MSIITGMFKDQESLNQTLCGLDNIGISPDELSVVMSHALHGRRILMVAPNTTLAVRTIVFPLFGVIATGPIVAALAGASAGGVTGGLIGALAGAGIRRQEAVLFEDGISQGKLLLAVHVEGGRETLVREVFHAAGAQLAMAA
jgi:hypothetical protein